MNILLTKKQLNSMDESDFDRKKQTNKKQIKFLFIEHFFC